jgi:hypothetical protein
MLLFKTYCRKHLLNSQTAKNTNTNDSKVTSRKNSDFPTPLLYLSVTDYSKYGTNLKEVKGMKLTL